MYVCILLVHYFLTCVINVVVFWIVPFNHNHNDEDDINNSWYTKEDSKNND